MRVEAKDRWIKILKVFTILALAAYVVKNIFVGMDVDEEYGVVAAYRILKGDKLLLQMWEPHQTAAIFTAILEKPMLMLMGGRTDFLDLYLKIVYFIIHSLITVFIYKTLKKYVAGLDKNAAVLTALIFFATSPKSTFVPEYSNLHIWFFTLLTMCLVRYYSPLCGQAKGHAVDSDKASALSDDCGHILWLFAAGMSMTGDVMAYPALILIVPLCVLFICRRHVRRVWLELTAFFAPCVISFIIFAGYLLSYMTPSKIMEMVGYVLADGSHQLDYGEKILTILSEFAIMALCIIFSAAAALIIVHIYLKLTHTERNKEKKILAVVFVFLMIQIVIQFVCCFVSKYSGYYPHILYIAVSILGIFLYRNGDRENKTGFYMILLSATGYLCVLFMSNWEPMKLNCYMVTGVIGGFICIHSYFKESALVKGINVISLVSLLIIFVNIFGYCYLIIGGEDSHSTIFSVGGYGRDGVKKGIFSSWMSAYRYNTNMEMWDDIIPEDSNVLYVGQSQCFYMMGECNIAAPNTISTPVWDEKIMRYWEINPDKYPDVVVFESWYGDIWYSEDNYVMQWVENEYGYTRMEEYPFVTVYYR
jgi:hypothetical protein